MSVQIAGWLCSAFSFWAWIFLFPCLATCNVAIRICIIRAWLQAHHYFNAQKEKRRTLVKKGDFYIGMTQRLTVSLESIFRRGFLERGSFRGGWEISLWAAVYSITTLTLEEVGGSAWPWHGNSCLREFPKVSRGVRLYNCMHLWTSF